ncbi:hypothetical protein B7Y94_05880 [Candidatus Saccharibacteria bacterium 32-49-12]|nr:MAG: hypothetical protein B7Y94_05880 [Candidatus Saccharibacteria bacterium 32-49-12]
MLNVKNTMLDALLELIAPHLCSSCGAIGSVFCDNCKYDIVYPDEDFCWCCGNAYRGRLCDDCRLIIKEIDCLGARSGGLQNLIGGLKFQYRRAAAKRLAGLMLPIVEQLSNDALLTYIPTRASNIRIRGYDHMALIARNIQKLSGRQVCRLIAVADSHLSQHKLSKTARQIAASAAFHLTANSVSGRQVVIIDDIVTTGATVRAAAQVLRDGGAADVSVLMIARQPSTTIRQSVKIA